MTDLHAMAHVTPGKGSCNLVPPEIPVRATSGDTGAVIPHPVAVVGAGPVGLTVALLLARRGVGVVLLEKHAEPYLLPRAVHVDDEVFRVLQAAGVADAV